MLFELGDGTRHLHSGDFRFHPSFRLHPTLAALSAAAGYYCPLSPTRNWVVTAGLVQWPTRISYACISLEHPTLAALFAAAGY
eukprot:3631290-Rhodomonas_salina.1